MHFHDVALAAVAFLSEILGTISGFGSSTFFVPIAALFENFQLVLALTAILHCLGNTFKIVLFSRAFHWTAFLQMAIPSIIFTVLGALLTTVLPIKIITKCLGIMLMIFPFVMILKSRSTQKLPTWLAMVLSALSGFSTGLVGTGGAIRGLALSAMQLPKNSFVAISSGIDISGDFLRAAIYIKNGFMDWNQWFYLPLLALAAFFGIKVGQLILHRLPQNHFEKLVAVFIFISGLLLVWQ